MSDSLRYQYPVTDLIDALTIEQIKEMLLSGKQNSGRADAMKALAADIEDALEVRQVGSPGRLLRLVTLLAQANLHVWHNKDRMADGADDYLPLLTQAQELNGLRNHVRNLMMALLNENTAANRRATFLEATEERWYTPLVRQLTESNRTAAERTQSLSVSDFSRAFGAPDTEFPANSRAIMEQRDFRYRSLTPNERDELVLEIVKRVDTGDFWISGPGKQSIWEKGWSENLSEFEQSGEIKCLTPKFVRRHKPVRLFGDYVLPEDGDFESNFVDALRQWLFPKYFGSLAAIYDFGCGSCQHLPMLATLFPEAEIHGLDWAEASSHIVTRLRKEKGWNVHGHVFNIFEPDAGLQLKKPAGVLTVGTMEQIGEGFGPFLDYLMEQKPTIVLHIETLVELYDPSKLTDYLALRYDLKRNYLNGYLTRLRDLEAEGKVTIHEARKVELGSLYHDGYSFLAWSPR